jgi:tetratricopeptide (TPR) repeat protein
MGREQTWRRKRLYFYVAGMILLYFPGCVVPEKAKVRIKPQEEAHQYLLRGKEFLAQGDFQEALKENQKILDLAAHQPPEDEALFNIGMIYAHPEILKRDPAKSLYYFNRVAEEFPQSPWAFQARGWKAMLQDWMAMLQERSRLTQRVELLNRQIQQFQEEKRKVEEERATLQPVLNIRELLSHGKYEEALREIQKMLAATPRILQEDEALFQMGLINAHPGNPKRDYGKSLGYFKKLMKEYPKNPWTELAKAWTGMVQENEKLNQTVEKLNQTIEKSKQVDIEIEEKKRGKGK